MKFRVWTSGVLIMAVLFAFLVAISPARAEAASSACWGQATQVFAQTGEMGEHSSQQATPRMGLRNLARALYAEGALDDDSMQALGGFVAREMGLSISACE